MAALTARNTNASVHHLSTSAPVRSAPSRQSGLKGFLFIHQRACHHRSAPEVGHVASAWFFSAGTWRHLLWQINQRAFNALRAALPKCLLGGALRRCPLRVSTVVRHLPAWPVHRLRSHLWPPSTTFIAPKPVAPSTVRTVGWQRCLTLRSRRAPTAGRATAACYSCFRPACHWRRLTSNVRQRKMRNTNTSLRNRFTSAPSL